MDAGLDSSLTSVVSIVVVTNASVEITGSSVVVSFAKAVVITSSTSLVVSKVVVDDVVVVDVCVVIVVDVSIASVVVEAEFDVMSFVVSVCKISVEVSKFAGVVDVDITSVLKL